MTQPAPVSFVKDDKGAPAVDLAKVEATNPDLAKIAHKAGIALGKRNLSGIRAKVKVLLDHSLSMLDDYQSGKVQKLLTRCLGFSLQVDSDGTIPVVPFDSRVWPEVEVTQDNFSTAATAIWKPNNMGSTNLAGALATIKQDAETSDEIQFVIVLTDGNPDNQDAATAVVCELANYAVLLKFLALRPVTYLSTLDDLPSTMRRVDNVDTKPSTDYPINLLECSDAEFVDALADEWDSWIQEATAAGIIKV